MSKMGLGGGNGRNDVLLLTPPIDEEIGGIPGLSFTSNALHGVGIAPVIKQADQVARKVVSSLRGSSDASDS